MSYVDGYVIAVPTQNKQAYIKLAEEAAAIFKKYGALSIVECWGDNVPVGKLTSFPQAVQCKDDETVVFSWIIWPSKEVQKVGMEKFAQDPFCDPNNNPMVFDGKRMIFGSFDVIVEH